MPKKEHKKADPYPQYLRQGQLGEITPFAEMILDDATAAEVLTTLGVSSFAQTILDDTSAGAALTTLGVSAFVQTILNDATGGDVQTTLGISTFAKTLLDDASGSDAQTTLGITAFAKTILDDAAAGDALTTLGVSAFAQTVLDDADAATARATLSAAPRSIPAFTYGADSELTAEQSMEPFFGRISRNSSTQIDLSAFGGGQFVIVNGKKVSLSSDLTLATTDNLIAGDGTDSGGAMGTSTLYYVYVSNADASFAATDLRASTTAPSDHLGSKYLATSGNGANWRFVGYVRTDGSTEFVDSERYRLVINYYNQRPLEFFHCPAYNDDGNTTTYTVASATFVEANGSGNGRVGIISDGRSGIMAAVNFYSGTDFGYSGIGIDGITDVRRMMFGPSGYAMGVSSPLPVLSEGFHELYLLVRGDTSGSKTILADADRDLQGSTADVPITWIGGIVMG